MMFDELTTVEKDALHKLSQKEPYEGSVPGFDALVRRGLATTNSGWTQLNSSGREMIRSDAFIEWRKRRWYQR